MKLCLPSLIEQNPVAFATGVMAEAARRFVDRDDFAVADERAREVRSSPPVELPRVGHPVPC